MCRLCAFEIISIHTIQIFCLLKLLYYVINGRCVHRQKERRVTPDAHKHTHFFSNSIPIFVEKSFMQANARKKNAYAAENCPQSL